MNILMVLTSHDTLGNTGLKTGFWLEEFASPYYAFMDDAVFYPGGHGALHPMGRAPIHPWDEGFCSGSGHQR